MPQASDNRDQDLTSHTDAFWHADEKLANKHARTGNSARASLSLSPTSPDMQQRASKGRWRLLVGSSYSSLYLLAVLLFSVAGVVDRATLLLAGAMIGVLACIFYAIIFLSKSQKNTTKKLIAPIACSAVMVMLIVTYRAPESRLIFSSFVFVAIAYGMYFLSRRAMLLLSAGTLAGYALVMTLQYLQKHDTVLLKSELLGWMVLALTLPGFVLLAGRVRQLHSALYRASMKIKDIEETARRDPLLGCYNRRFMVTALEEHKRLADTHGTGLCLALIDLDYFKRINDEVGHLAGDDVLRDFARIAQENVRQVDIFGRYGGEEFLLILPQTRLQAALRTVERIRQKVETNRWDKALNAPVTVSIGLTQYSPGESVLDLFARSDTAMYLAKRGGRNQVVMEEVHGELWQNATR